MLQAFIEVKRGLPINTDIMCAAEGFEQLGYTIRTFERTDILTDKFRLLYRTNPFVGSIDTMRTLFRREKVEPSPIDFPVDMNFGRMISKLSLKSALNFFETTGLHLFIKPVETKLFDGMLLRHKNLLNYFTPFLEENPECWVSNELNILSEWRGFVHNGQLVDCRQYKGNFRLQPDMSFLDTSVENCPLAISAYTVDVALIEDLSTVIIEVNDFWAIGSYGLEPQLYAQMLADRYFEIIND